MKRAERRASIAVMCIAVLAPLEWMGCAPGDTEAEMDEQALNDFGIRYTAAWNRRDAAAVAALHAEGSSLAINGGEPAVGREEIAAAAQAFMTAFPDMVLVMDSLRTGRGAVEYHWTFSGRNTGPGGTGNAVRFSGYEEWTFGENGLLTASRGHYDEAEHARQVEVGVGR